MTVDRTYSIVQEGQAVFEGDFMDCMKAVKHMPGPLKVLRDDGAVLAQKTAESGGLYWKYMKEKREASSADTSKRRGRTKRTKKK